MNNGVKIAIACGCLLLAAVIYYVRAGNVNDLTSNRSFNTRLKCLACGYEYKDEVEAGTRAPFKCPKCAKMDAWYMWECNQCHQVFTPEPTGNPPDQPMMPKCPKCGSTSTGRASV